MGRAKQKLAAPNRQQPTPVCGSIGFSVMEAVWPSKILCYLAHNTFVLGSWIREKPLLGEYLGVILTRGKKAFLVGLRSGTADTPSSRLCSHLAGHLWNPCLEPGTPESTFHM